MNRAKETFDVLNVKLEGQNLIEASAGTGKTFSIAILVLRLLIEKKIAIENLLVVTFTNSAVAELKERIRSFISEALNYMINPNAKGDNELIRALCSGYDAKDEVINRLKLAIQSIDDAGIFTIHGFCQKMLNDFAFETKQNFMAELQNDVSAYIDLYTNEFWRKELSLLPPEIFDIKELKNLKNDISHFLKKGLGEVYLLDFDKFIEDITEKISELIYEITSILENLDSIEQEIQNELNLNFNQIIDDYNGIKRITKISVPIRKDELLSKVLARATKGISDYIPTFKSSIWSMLLRQIEESEKLKSKKIELSHYLMVKGVKIYLPRLKDAIFNANVLTFDALILNLHQSIVQEKNSRLIQLIQQKFSAVLIDEFQDTDFIQFQIFRELFVGPSANQDNILFLIGDPKQSIYSFRNADVESYLHAGRSIAKQYTMDTNFRSSRNMINSVNNFYQAVGDIAFGYEDSENASIKYQKVKTNDNEKGLLKNGIEITECLTFSELSSKEKAVENIVNLIGQLLNPESRYELVLDDGNKRPVQPSDIAVLTRDNDTLQKFKNILSDQNIPSVSLQSNSVFQSREADDLILIMEAMVHNDLNRIKSALFMTFVHRVYKILSNDIMPVANFEEISLIELFNEYKKVMFEKGAYHALTKLFNDFSIYLYFTKQPSTQRILSNVIQLAELIHDYEYRNGSTPQDLILWLKKNKKNKSNQGESDDSLLRIESDRNSVTLITAHKSKGLEFPIVLVHGLNQEIKQDLSFIEAKDGQGKKIIVYKKPDNSFEPEYLNYYIRNEYQENCRLVYVAMTRAVYYCNISFSNNAKQGALLNMLKSIGDVENVTKNITFDHFPVELHHFEQENSSIREIDLPLHALIQSKSDWELYSYSSLRMEHDLLSAPIAVQEDEYNHFIFNVLPRGADPGTRLHQLLEKVRFAKDYRDLSSISEYEQRMLSLFDSKDQSYVGEISQMLHHIMHARIQMDNVSFYLKDVPQDQCIHEVEFNFPIGDVEIVKMLNPLLREYKYNAQITDKFNTLNGMMVGFIDLIFQYGSKYYILDWKSNYLGCDLSDYEEVKLQQAMVEHQYNLQYLIYTLAADKYLSQRLGEGYNYERDFGGIIYFFIRGVRADAGSGIFTDKPSGEYIKRLHEILNPNI